MSPSCHISFYRILGIVIFPRTKSASANLQHPSVHRRSSFRPLEGWAKCIHRDDKWRAVASPSQLGEWEGPCLGQTNVHSLLARAYVLSLQTKEQRCFCFIWSIGLNRKTISSNHNCICQAFAWKYLRTKASQWTRPSRSRPFNLSELALVS